MPSERSTFQMDAHAKVVDKKTGAAVSKTGDTSLEHRVTVDGLILQTNTRSWQGSAMEILIICVVW